MEKEVYLRLTGDPDAVEAATTLLVTMLGDAFQAPVPASRGGGQVKYGLIRVEVAPPVAREAAVELPKASATASPDTDKYHITPAGDGLTRLNVRSVNE